MFDPDKIDKKIITIRNNTFDNPINFYLSESIRNVLAIKFLSYKPTLNANIDNLNRDNRDILFTLSDRNDESYNLKELYSSNTTITNDNSTHTYNTNYFSNFNILHEYTGTGILSEFSIDSDTYNFNPILPKLDRIIINFKNIDSDTNINQDNITNFNMDFVIYSMNPKLTMQ
tara:strand:+ start:776 stop:1294 length:519 start_codon:yes stop_codon:yes gene_type:complete